MKRFLKILATVVGIYLVGWLGYNYLIKKEKFVVTKFIVPNIIGDEFTFDSINAYLSAVPEKNKKVGREIFLAAIDAAVNKKNYIAADSLFLKSTQLNPSSQTYFEWGKVLSKLKKNNRAVASFNMAEKMGYDNTQGILVEAAKAYAALNDTIKAKEYFIAAVQSGFSEESFERYEIKELQKKLGNNFNSILYHYSQAKKEGEINFSFANFLKPFDNVKAPKEYKLFKNTESYKKYIGFEFEKYITEMRNAEKYDRMTNLNVYSEGKFTVDSNLTAVCYSVWQTLSSPALFQLKIAIFNNQGKLMDKIFAAGLENKNSEFRTVKLLKNNLIEIHYHTYKEDEETGNLMADKELRSEKYTVNANGKFVKL